MRKVGLGAIVLAVIFSSYQVAMALRNRGNTGILQASASDKSAVLTLLEAGHREINLSPGNAKVRLLPGSYRLVATANKLQAVSSTQITRGQVTNLHLQLPTTQQPQELQKDAEANKLIQFLPFTGRTYEYRISYRYQSDQGAYHPVIVITAPTQSGQQKALDWIKNQGYNISNLQIEYSSAPINQLQ